MKRLPSIKTLALALAGLVVACLLFAWLLLPRIIQSQAEKFITEKTGHHLVMDRPELNPLKLGLHLSGLHLTQPDGGPLLAFRDLFVDLSAASIYRGVFTFDSIRLDGLEATVVLLPDGQLNWSALIGSLKGKGETSSSSPPKLDIRHFVMSGARVDFSDRQTAPAFATRIEPLDVELSNISTLPNEKGQYKVSARATGASIAWHGEASLEPLATTGSFSVDDVDLARLSPFFKDSLPVAPPIGKAGLSADYRFAYAGGHMSLNLEHIQAKASGLELHGNGKPFPVATVAAIEAKEGSFDMTKNEFSLGSLGVTGCKLGFRQDGAEIKKALELNSIALEDARVNLASHQATLGGLILQGGGVRATRNAKGRIDLMEALQAASPPAQAGRDKKNEPAGTTAEAGWRYRLEKLKLAGFSAAFRDESVAPAAEMAVEDIALSLQGISEDWKVAVPLRASFKVHSGGSFEADGNVTPSGPMADIHMKLAELNLAPVQPYLATAVNLKLVDGRLSTEGRARYNAKESSYQGSFDLRDLRLDDSGNGELFLAWKALGSREFKVTPKRLDIGELTLSGLNTKLVINKDKTVSVTKIIKQPAVAGSDAPAAPSAPPKAAASTPRFMVNIDRFRISAGEMDFADYSLALPFGARIHDLKGFITGISTEPGAPGQVELDGQVDDYGLARAVGQVDFLNPTNSMDMKVVFRNIEMTSLTPYSATFVGRRIDSGKLSLDLEYKIHQRQLQGENQVVMDQLVLGERVESPEAKNLPLDLALAILKDSDGRIDLGLPVSGSLDDPQFSYGGIIWKAITNVLTKIVTAPFRALGALFGGNEKSENIAFEAGDAQLTPPEREKLVRLAGILTKRPSLSVTVHGAYAEMDRSALQDRQLRRSLFENIGQQVEGDGDPGPVSMHQPKVQAALESMFSKSFGDEKLASLKESFHQANPGQPEQGAAGKTAPAPPAQDSKKQAMDEQEAARLKGADFYTILYERLRNAVAVNDGQLQALAAARGEFTITALKAAGAPADRLAVLAAEKVEAGGMDVPVKLVLGAASKPATPAAPGVPAK